MTWKIEHNDVIEWAKNYDGPPFHAALLDPPYHLTSITKRFGKPGSAPAKGDVYRRASAGFMGARWDGGGIAFDPATWAALSQHLYPGAFIMAFGGSRGYHRMATAMEDAGLIIHPAMGWLQCQGFPKATRIDTQIDKAAGAEREVIGPNIRLGDKKEYPVNPSMRGASWQNTSANKTNSMGDITAPATPLARDWAGHRYGLQALKPSFEFVAVAQVPYSGRPVDSIVKTGAGALNIEQGRIPTNGETWAGNAENAHNNYSADVYGKFASQYAKPSNPAGRWPSNFLLQHHPEDNGECHPDCPVRLFDEQAGESVSKSGGIRGELSGWGLKDMERGGYDDSGPASRMFHQSSWQYEVAEALANADDASEHTEVCPVRYEPKVSGAEREAGLDGFEVRPAGIGDDRPGGDFNQRLKPPGRENIQPVKARNNHPTLKPISLTKYLATLLLPPAAYAPRRILIPFAGSGSECIGAMLAGFEEIVGIEQSEQYCSIARARLRWWSQWPGWGQTDVDAILAAAGKEEGTGQMSLFGKAASPKGT